MLFGRTAVALLLVSTTLAASGSGSSNRSGSGSDGSSSTQSVSGSGDDDDNFAVTPTNHPVPPTLSVTFTMDVDLSSLSATDLNAVKDGVVSSTAAVGGFTAADVTSVGLEQDGATFRRQRRANAPITGTLSFAAGSVDPAVVAATINSAVSAGTFSIMVTFSDGTTLTSVVAEPIRVGLDPTSTIIATRPAAVTPPPPPPPSSPSPQPTQATTYYVAGNKSRRYLAWAIIMSGFVVLFVLIVVHSHALRNAKLKQFDGTTNATNAMRFDIPETKSAFIPNYDYAADYGSSGGGVLPNNRFGHVSGSLQYGPPRDIVLHLSPESANNIRRITTSTV
jgi:hypothetical protein